MNFTKVDLISSDSEEIISMSFQDPTLEYSYVLKALLGLDVDELTTRYYGRSAMGNNPFYTMNVGPRTVVIQVRLNPNYAVGETVRSLRARVYKAISSTRTGALTLRFLNEQTSVAAISGFVTKVEAEHFSSKPELKITLDCGRDSLLRGESYISVPTDFDNPQQAVIVDDVSEAPHGFKLDLRCSAPSASLVFSDTNPHQWSFQISPGVIDGSSGFLTGDRVFMSSEDNDKQLYIVRGGVTYHLANQILAGSVWPIMFPGTTTFSITPNFDWESISYRTAYWGI